jgi:RimJ/RimL family protein N-acetyltransferase
MTVAVTDPGLSGSHAQPTLHTDHIELVPLADEHLELEVELDSDPEVLRYLNPGARTRAEVKEAHRRRMAAAGTVPGLGFWVGFVDRDFVGWWILQPPEGPGQPYGTDQADLGYRIQRRHWRRGLASEGSRALMRYGFMDIGLRRIFAQTLVVNTPSQAVMTSLGMHYARSFPADYPDGIPGVEHGEVEYAITRDEWLR